MRFVRHWPLWLLIALLPVMAGSWCDPIEYDQDGGTGDGGTGDGGSSLSRIVTFDGQSQGEWGGGTIDEVVLTVSAYYGSQTATIANTFGEGQDLGLACATVTVQPPESHGSFALYFDDAQGTLLVDILDQDGASFLSQPINTLTDASTYGITAYDSVYKKLTADASDSSRQIGALLIGSCSGYVHEITFN